MPYIVTVEKIENVESQEDNSILYRDTIDPDSRRISSQPGPVFVAVNKTKVFEQRLERLSVAKLARFINGDKQDKE